MEKRACLKRSETARQAKSFDGKNPWLPFQLTLPLDRFLPIFQALYCVSPFPSQTLQHLKRRGKMR